MSIGTGILRRGWALGIFALATMMANAAETSLHPVANPAPVLEDLHRKMSALNSVYFEFTQERQLKLFAEPLKSEGVLLIGRPDKIRWETTSPFQSILMGDHETVAQFEKEDGQWKKLKLGFPQMMRRVMEQMSMMHQGKMDALTADFNVSVATGSVAVVTLIPKDQSIRSVLSPRCLAILRSLSVLFVTSCATTKSKSTSGAELQFPPNAFMTHRAIFTARGKQFALTGYLVLSESQGKRLIISQQLGQTMA